MEPEAEDSLAEDHPGATEVEAEGEGVVDEVGEVEEAEVKALAWAGGRPPSPLRAPLIWMPSWRPTILMPCKHNNTNDTRAPATLPFRFASIYALLQSQSFHSRLLQFLHACRFTSLLPSMIAVRNLAIWRFFLDYSIPDFASAAENPEFLNPDMSNCVH